MPCSGQTACRGQSRPAGRGRNDWKSTALTSTAFVETGVSRIPVMQRVYQSIPTRQLGLHPPQRQRVEREHVQPGGVHQQVLARPRRPQPSQATAYRVLTELERRHPLFRLSTKRNRDIADRPEGSYGKLRPTRPGEYLLMDTTRLDVFAFDPLTLRWVQAELTVGMDWYTRCITGIRLTPVSTKAVDVSAVLFQSFRPRPAGRDWPRHAVWPEHGIPRTGPGRRRAAADRAGAGLGRRWSPETLVVDHGKIYVSEHLTSVCRRMGISIQPARLRTGRDKGPVERFFRTLREGLLQALPGYKGPDIHCRGREPGGRGVLLPRRA